MKFVAREIEEVDAYLFKGGEKDGKALEKLLEEFTHGVATWRPAGPRWREHIGLVDDCGSYHITVGEWVIFHQYGFDHLSPEEFKAKYKQPKLPPVIWKDIPGYPNWQIGNNGKVRDIRFNGYGRRTKAGHFNLYVNGKKHQWSEAEIGDEEAVRKFFAN